MTNGDERVESRLGTVLAERDETLAIAESATGGLVCSKVTDVSGASEYFDRGYVTYAYRAKLAELGVSRETLDDAGAVSEPVAAQMARGARDRADTEWGLSVTGIAGPTGGRPDKPVGTTFIGVSRAAPWGTGASTVWVSRYRFEGDRLAIKQAAATQALTDVVERIAEAGSPD